MATTTIYPFGTSTETPTGAILTELSEMQEVLDDLAPWAFKGERYGENPPFIDTAFFPVSGVSNSAILRIGTNANQVTYMVSPVYKLGEIGDSVSIRFSAGVIASGTYPCLAFFDANGEYTTYYTATSNPRTVSFTISADMQYCRLVFAAEHLYSSYIYDVANSAYLFNGADVSTASFKTGEMFLTSNYLPNDYKANSNGDFLGWNFSNSDSAATAQQNVFNAAMYCKTGRGSSPFSYGISALVKLPSNVSSVNVEFSCGVVNSSLMLRLLNENTKTANYYTANANPRTVSLSTSQWTHVQLYFLTANYASCYIKNADTNEYLWKGLSS